MLSRAFRRSFGLSLAILLVAGLGSAALIALTDDPDTPVIAAAPGELRSFHFIAYITPPDPPDDHPEGAAGVFEVWYLARDKTRWEIYATTAPEQRNVFGTDGAISYRYDVDENAYWIAPLDFGLLGPMYAPSRYLVGPTDMTAEEWLVTYRAQNARIVKEQIVAGRRATVIAYEGDGPRVTVWIDAESATYPFVLRELVEEADGSGFLVDTIAVEFNEPIDSMGSVFGRRKGPNRDGAKPTEAITGRTGQNKPGSARHPASWNRRTYPAATRSLTLAT